MCVCCNTVHSALCVQHSSRSSADLQQDSILHCTCCHCTALLSYLPAQPTTPPPVSPPPRPPPHIHKTYSLKPTQELALLRAHSNPVLALGSCCPQMCRPCS